METSPSSPFGPRKTPALPAWFPVRTQPVTAGDTPFAPEILYPLCNQARRAWSLRGLLWQPLAAGIKLANELPTPPVPEQATTEHTTGNQASSDRSSNDPASNDPASDDKDVDTPASATSAGPATETDVDEAAWLKRFWAGEKKIIEGVYLEHFDAVQGAVGRILHGADQETVTHEVFFRLVSEEDFRRRFSGGALRAWLNTVARNRAIDFYRRRNREEVMDGEDLERFAGSADADRFVEKVEARQVVERFRKEVLPAKWAGVFETRFMKQLSQREAAAELQLSRTTLAYQELRLRSLLETFLLNLTGEVAS